MKNMRRVVEFILLTCLFSWLIAGVAIWLGLRQAQGLIYYVFGVFYMFLPAICSMILQKIHKEKIFRNLHISFRINIWFLIAGAIPILFVFLALSINLLFSGVTFSSNFESLISSLPADQAVYVTEKLSKIPPVIYLMILLVQVIVVGYTVNAFIAFGEEMGWRGYLLKAFGHKSFLVVTLVIGFVWGLWHFPLILIGHNYPQHRVAGIGMMIIWCILISPIITYIAIKSKSIVTAAIFHGTLNAVAGIDVVYVVGGNDLLNGAKGLSGFIALLFINVCLFLYDRYVRKENIYTSKIVF